MTPGIYKNIPFEEYSKWEGVNKSMFKYAIRSGKALKHYMDHGDEEESKVMIFGNLVDTMLFEPNKLIDRYVTTPEMYPSEKGDKPWNWNANYCKKWRSELPDNINIVSPGDIDKAKKIVESIRNHPQASKWLVEAEYQVSLSWIDPITGMSCKGRPDIVKDYCIPDLKISYDCHPKAFSKTLNSFLYHAGAAFYHDGYFLSKGVPIPDGGQSIPMCFIVAEDKEPFDVVCYVLSQESFEIGRGIYRHALDLIAEYSESDEYPGYSNVIEEISIPVWATNKFQLEGVIE